MLVLHAIAALTLAPTCDAAMRLCGCVCACVRACVRVPCGDLAGEDEFYRVMKYKGAHPLDVSSDEDD